MDAFTEAYLTAALWSTPDYEQGDDGLDANYGITDIAPETLAQVEADCKAFQDAHGEDIEALGASQAGHDYWLTRNGHGCGFWDGDWPEPQADRLMQAADEAGGYDLLVGDDGMIHGYPEKPTRQ